MATASVNDRVCMTCRERKPAGEFPSTRAKRCTACATYKPPRECRRCGELKPASEFVHRGVCCSTCRATPPPSEIRYRACLHCHVVKHPAEFPMGDGLHGKGINRRRRGVCFECIAREKADGEAERAARKRKLQTWEENGQTVRRCSGCRGVFELTENFYRDGANADGSDKFGYRCKPCAIKAANARKKRDPNLREKNARRNREWRRRNPERSREIQRAYRARMMADPERHAARLEAERIAHRLRRERSDGVALADIRPITPSYGRPKNRTVSVPSAQLARVVIDAAHAEGGPAAANNRDGMLEFVCERVGVSERALYGWRIGERPHIGIDVADRVLTGLDLLWWDVWNEETVRRPLILARTYTRRMKLGRRGVKRAVIERGERHYGDAGPDFDTLREVENAWEGDHEEATAA